MDTNALIWLLAGHKRASKLPKNEKRFYVSPVSLLELTFLNELGRIRFSRGTLDIQNHPRLAVDDPSSVELFAQAQNVAWTRDPFDRLITAHAALRRWKLATGDAHMLTQLDPKAVLEL
ncbi:MAG: PIN domain-containing protein [Deltaproteobacteria bacterium]|nr:PIN domain-containing protein [Deltaproteobacteria bacterium]